MLYTNDKVDITLLIVLKSRYHFFLCQILSIIAIKHDSVYFFFIGFIISCY